MSKKDKKINKDVIQYLNKGARRANTIAKVAGGLCLADLTAMVLWLNTHKDAHETFFILLLMGMALFGTAMTSYGKAIQNEYDIQQYKKMQKQKSR